MSVEKDWFREHMSESLFSAYSMLFVEAKNEFNKPDSKKDLVELKARFRDLIFQMDDSLMEEAFSRIHPVFALLDQEFHDRYEREDLGEAMRKSGYAAAICRNLWEKGRMTHKELAAQLGISESNLSNHLNRIRPFRIVEESKLGLFVFCTVSKRGVKMLDLPGAQTDCSPDRDVSQRREIIPSHPRLAPAMACSAGASPGPRNQVPDRNGAPRTSSRAKMTF